MTIRKSSPNRRKKKLHRRERGNDRADGEALGPNGFDDIGDEVLAINRHQRHDDAKADEVNENRQENDQDRRFSHERTPK